MAFSEYIFEKNNEPLVKNTVEYTFMWRKQRCSFSIDQMYLNQNFDKKLIVFSPASLIDPCKDSYNFCNNIIPNIVYKMANKEIGITNKIIVTINTNDLKNPMIIEAE